MTEVFELLVACAEAVERQQEMLPLLGRAVGVRPEDVFYTWARRACKQRGSLEEPGWQYFFHGLECDLRNANDGRRVRLDFGPQGTVETLTAWGVFQFIFCSVPPWRAFPGLRAKYRGDDWTSEDYRRGWTEAFLLDWDRLEELGCLAPAAPELVELQKRFTSPGPDGLATVRFPQDIAEDTRVDCSVAHRPRITEVGRSLLSQGKRDDIVARTR